jgi:hypothetical protein
MRKNKAMETTTQSCEKKSITSVLLILAQGMFLHSLQAIVHPLFSQSQRVVFSLSFGYETILIF